MPQGERASGRMIHSEGEKGYGATHYEVLSASPASTLEEIRACYRAALLSVHPDKLGTHRPDGLEEAADMSSRYLRVQEAWSVLRDADSRARYDASMKSGGGGTTDVVVGEEVGLEEDMEECVGEAGDVEYWYPCRCGDFFEVGARELKLAGLGFGERSTCSGAAEGCGGDGFQCDRERQSIVLPCGSCSLHLRVHFWAPCS